MEEEVYVQLTFNDRDLKALWFASYKALGQPEVQITARSMTKAVRAHAIEVAKNVDLISDRFNRGLVEETKYNNAFRTEAADGFYQWMDLAERLEQLSDVEALALYTRAQKWGQST